MAIINIGDPTIWEQTIEAVGNRGRIVTSGAMFGGRAAFNARTFYERNQTIFGVRTANRESTERCWSRFNEAYGRLSTRSSRSSEAADAHRRIEAGRNVGRVVLTVN